MQGPDIHTLGLLLIKDRANGLGNTCEELPPPLACFLKKFLPFLQSGLPLSKLFSIFLCGCLSFLQLFDIPFRDLTSLLSSSSFCNILSVSVILFSLYHTSLRFLK